MLIIYMKMTLRITLLVFFCFLLEVTIIEIFFFINIDFNIQLIIIADYKKLKIDSLSLTEPIQDLHSPFPLKIA